MNLKNVSKKNIRTNYKLVFSKKYFKEIYILYIIAVK